MAVNGADLLVDLAFVTGAAAITTILFHRLRQPVVVGYLLAGFLIGPHSPLLGLDSVASVQTLADLGIVFLLFSIGLEFRLGRLARSGLPAVVPALAGIAAVVGSTMLVGRVAGWSSADALFMGAILAISSTVIAAKAVLESGQAAQRWAELALAVLIVQDVVAVAILALLGATAGQGSGLGGIAGILGELATFAIAVVVLGLLFVPRLVNRLVRERADEVLVVTLAGLALVTAVVALLLGFSPALGAFLIGAVVAEASEAWSAERRVMPLRDLFTAVFFVSIGMLLDPAQLLAHWQPAVALALLMVLVKVGAHALPAFLLGTPPRDAWKASLALGQIGEFSFAIAALGLALGAVSGFVLPVTVAIAAASALWTPYLLRASEPLYVRLAARAPRILEAGAARYRRWLAARQGRPSRLDTDQRRLAKRAAVNALAVALILLATADASRTIQEWVTVRGLTDRTIALLPWLAGGVVALPFAFIAARSGGALLDSLAPASQRATRLRRFARASVVVVLAALVVFGAFLAAAPFLPPLPLLVLMLAAFLGASVVLWETMVRLHRSVEEALEAALGGVAQGDERRAVLDALRHEYRLGAEVDSARVEGGTVAVGATVRGLDLRARTGATLVGVQRGGRTMVNPAPGLTLREGDRLVLLGDEDQLAAAREALREALPASVPAEASIAQVAVEPDSPLAGVTLAESALRERTGASVVGILRAGQRVANPGAATRIEAGDVLLVVGAEGEVRAAAAFARADRAASGHGAGGAPGAAP